MFHKAVVLLGSAFCQRLEPVRAMGGTQLHGPLLHAFCHGVGGSHVQFCAVVHDVAHLGVNVCRQVLQHFLSGKHVLGKELAGTVFAIRHFYGTLLERLAYHMES